MSACLDRSAYLYGVQAPDARKRWAVVRPWAEKLAAETGGRFLAEDILAHIEAQQIGLWLVMSGDQCTGICLTQILQWPRLREARFWGIAGRGFENWRHLQPVLEAWARSKGCTRFAMEGRVGWARLLHDWTQTRVVMEKVL